VQVIDRTYRINYKFLLELVRALMEPEELYINNQMLYEKYFSFPKLIRVFP
jgi:hypothetical protein